MKGKVKFTVLAAVLAVLGMAAVSFADDISDEEIMKIAETNLRILNLAATEWCDRYPEGDKMVDGVKFYYVHIGVSTIDETNGSRVFHGDIWVNSDTKTVRMEIAEVNESTQ